MTTDDMDTKLGFSDLKKNGGGQVVRCNHLLTDIPQALPPRV